jgi:hypothetical protein
MYISIIILKDEKKFDKVIQILIELQLYDSTIIDGEGIEPAIIESLPVFKELASLLGNEENVYNKTIISHIPEKEDLDYLVKICKEEGINFKEKNIGSIMAFKCDFYIGEE